MHTFTCGTGFEKKKQQKAKKKNITRGSVRRSLVRVREKNQIIHTNNGESGGTKRPFKEKCREFFRVRQRKLVRAYGR
jgi:hypothetical protein